jgi:hypothetical protein
VQGLGGEVGARVEQRLGRDGVDVGDVVSAVLGAAQLVDGRPVLGAVLGELLLERRPVQERLGGGVGLEETHLGDVERLDGEPRADHVTGDLRDRDRTARRSVQFLDDLESAVRGHGLSG